MILDRIQQSYDERSQNLAAYSRKASDLDKVLHFNSIENQREENSFSSKRYGWVPNSSNWSYGFILSTNHQLRYKAILQKVIASAYEKQMFPGFSVGQKDSHTGNSNLKETAKFEIDIHQNSESNESFLSSFNNPCICTPKNDLRDSLIESDKKKSKTAKKHKHTKKCLEERKKFEQKANNINSVLSSHLETQSEHSNYHKSKKPLKFEFDDSPDMI